MLSYLLGVIMPTTHGEYRLTLKNNLLILEATGPFNLQYVDRLVHDIQCKVSHIKKPWGQITVFNNDSIFVPDAFLKLKSSMQQRKESGLKVVAVILREPQCSFLIRSQISEIYQSAQIPFQFFDNFSEAEHWIAATLNGSDQD